MTDQSFNERVRAQYTAISTDPVRSRVLREVGWGGPLVEQKMPDDEKEATAKLLEDDVLMRTRYAKEYPSWLLDTTAAGEEILRLLNKRNLRCPTCSVNPGICCYCKKPIDKWEQKLEVDPYNSDLKGDERLHLQHERCKEEAAHEL